MVWVLEKATLFLAPLKSPSELLTVESFQEVKQFLTKLSMLRKELEYLLTQCLSQDLE